MLQIAAGVSILVTLHTVATSAALTAPSANFDVRSVAPLRSSTRVPDISWYHPSDCRASSTARRAHAFDLSWCRPRPTGSVPAGGSSSTLPNASVGNHRDLPTKHRLVGRLRMSSNYYDDFGDGFGDDEEDEDEDDEEEEDDDGMSDEEKAKIEMFRTQMMMGEGTTGFGGTSDATEEDVTETGADDVDEGDDDGDGRSFGSVDDLISFASSQAGVGGGGTATEAETDWAVPLLEMGDDSRPVESGGAVADALRGGAVLLANPAKFCADFGWGAERKKTQQPSPALLSKFGLTLPPPAELGPDRRADLLPVLMVLDRHPLRGSQAVLMNRRTGYLLGDLEQQEQLGGDDPPPSSSSSTTPRLGAFMIQPLWFGGTSAGSNGAGGGLDMLHQCEAVKGCKRLTEDGLFWGGDPVQAQDAMADPSLEKPLTGFEFKFFVQSTRWLPTQLEKEVREGTWFVASVSKEVLFKSRDRLGTKRAKPLWSEIMELMGGNYQSIRDELYAE